MSLQVTCTHRLQELVDLKDEWEALQARSQNPCFFFTWEWIAAYWKHLGEPDELWLLLARDEGGRLVGIAPLQRRVRSYGMRGLLGWTSLEFIAEPLGGVHTDFIIEAGQEAPVLEAFLAWLDRNRAAPEILLIGVPEESPTVPALENGSRRWERLEPRECPFIALPGDWDTHFNSLGKHKRKNQRIYWRKLDEAYPGQWAIEQVQEPEAVRRAMDLMMDWHQAKWIGQGAPGNFFNERRRAFHHEIAQRSLDRGWLWLFQMTVNGQPVCVDYNFAYLGRVYAFAGGTDPAFLHLSVNSLLIEHIMRQAIVRGLKEFDFLWGDHEYKLRWGAVLRYDQVLSHASGLQPRLYRGTLRTGRTVWRKVKPMLPDRLRKQVRDRVRRLLPS